MPTESTTAEEANAMPDPTATSRGLRSNGMRDLGPADMARFRQIERTFLEATAAAGYREIRTPTIEPLHLFTAAGTYTVLVTVHPQYGSSFDIYLVVRVS